MTTNLPALANASKNPLDGLPPALSAQIEHGEPNSYWRPPSLAEGEVETARQWLHVAEQSVKASGPAALTLYDALRPIGAKILPTMGPEQAQAWMTATIDALSDMPLDLIAEGIKAAKHKPMQFLSEVEGVVRAAVGDEMMRRLRIRNRLREIEAQAVRDGAPKPLADLRSDRGPISDAEHAEHMRRLNTPNVEAPSRGTTAADRAAWRAGEPTPGAAEREARDLGLVNMMRAMRGEQPWTRAEWIADSIAQANAWSASQRGSRVDEGHLVTPKRTKAIA